jgi:hypothetical protein
MVAGLARDNFEEMERAVDTRGRLKNIVSLQEEFLDGSF